MEYHRFNLFSSLFINIPGISLCIDRQVRIVVEVVEHTVVAIVDKHIVAGVVVGSVRVVHFTHIHILATDNRHTPKAAFDMVAGNHGGQLAGRVVDTDAATAVHRVSLVLVVNHCVANNIDVHRADSSNTVTVVGQFVVFNDYFVRPCSLQHVSYGNTAYHSTLVTDNFTVGDAQLTVAGSRQVDLRLVGIRRVVVV